MTLVQQVVTLVNNILQSTDNALRAQSEGILSSLAENQIVQLIGALIDILKSDQLVQIKTFVVTQLKKHLVAFDDNKYTKVWGKMSPQTQQFIRTTLFECLHKQTSANLRNLLGGVIGQIAGTIMNINVQYWPKFVQSVYILLGESVAQSMISALQILDGFFNFASQVFDKRGDELYVVFKNAFNHQNNKLKNIAIQAFSGFLVTANKKALSKVQTLIVPFYQVTYHLIINDKGNTQGLQILNDLAEVLPRILKTSFKQLTQLIKKVMQLKDLEAGAKRIAIQCLLTLAEKYQNLFLNNKDQLNQLIEMIFLQMIDISLEVTDEWKSPPEGFCEDLQKNDDYEATTFGMAAVDRLIAALQGSETIPLISLMIQKMLTVQDWRYTFASLMALSQIGEYVDDASQIKSILPMLYSRLTHQHPMVRFSATHAIGQIADDLRQQFQQLYGKQTFLKLAPLLKDSIPRVVSHTASSLANVIDGTDYEDIKIYIPQLMNILLQLSTSGISLVKTSVLTTISSIATIAQNQFIQFFEKTSQILFGIIQTHKGKEYKQLKGGVIETLTVIADSIGKEPFKVVAPHLIQYLITIQDSQIQDVDPQKQYVLQGWQKLCLVFGKDLSTYLPQVLPGLFKIVQQIVDKNIKNSVVQTALTPTSQQLKINTFETEEAETAIGMLNIFMKEMDEFYLPYIPRTVPIILAIVKSQINPQVKLQAFISLPLIVTMMKNNKLENGIQHAKSFLSILISVCNNTFDADVLTQQVDCMKQIFQCFKGEKFLEVNDLTQFSKQVIQLLTKSKERKAENKKQKDETDDIQQDEVKYFDDVEKGQEQVQVSISDLIGQIFKTHKEMNLPLVQYIVKTQLPKVFIPGASDKILKFGFFLIDDMIDHLGYDIMKGQWQDFEKVFLSYCTYTKTEVRQAACYGLGIYSEKTPHQIFKPKAQSILQLLVQATQIPKGEQTDNSFKFSKDNAVSAIGKIIKTHGSCFDPRAVLLVWLKNLPLRNDKEQAHKMHELLAQIILNNHSLIIPDNSTSSISTLTKVLQIFGDIIQTKLTKPPITQKIKECLKKLQSVPIFYENSDALWSSLTETQATKLTNLVKS